MAEPDATASVDATQSEGSTGAQQRRSVSDVEQNIMAIDIGTDEAQGRGLSEHSEFMSAQAKRLLSNAVDHNARLHLMAEQAIANSLAVSHQINANMADMAHKQGLRAINKVHDVAEAAIAGDIAKDTTKN